MRICNRCGKKDAEYDVIKMNLTHDVVNPKERPLFPTQTPPVDVCGGCIGELEMIVRKFLKIKVS